MGGLSISVGPPPAQSQHRGKTPATNNKSAAASDDECRRTTSVNRAVANHSKAGPLELVVDKSSWNLRLVPAYEIGLYMTKIVFIYFYRS